MPHIVDVTTHEILHTIHDVETSKLKERALNDSLREINLKVNVLQHCWEVTAMVRRIAIYAILIFSLFLTALSSILPSLFIKVTLLAKIGILFASSLFSGGIVCFYQYRRAARIKKQVDKITNEIALETYTKLDHIEAEKIGGVQHCYRNVPTRFNLKIEGTVGFFSAPPLEFVEVLKDSDLKEIQEKWNPWLQLRKEMEEKYSHYDVEKELISDFINGNHELFSSIRFNKKVFYKLNGNSIQITTSSASFAVTTADQFRQFLKEHFPLSSAA